MEKQALKGALADDHVEGKALPGAEASAGSAVRSDLLLILLLIILLMPLRVWQIQQTEVAARDSIGYIRIAWQLRQHPWKDVVKSADQHPGYPLALLAMLGPVRCFSDAPECLIMQWSAQLTSVACGLMLIVPMFFLGKELFNRTVGFWTAAFFQLIPAGSRVLADGLSEATFLLFAITAVLFAAKALRSRSLFLFGICGLLSGLAYLVRPEGALVAGSTALVLIGMQAAVRWRQTWVQLGLSGFCLLLGWCLVAAPYMHAIGGFTVKLSSKFMLDPSLKLSPPAPPDVVWQEPEPAGFCGPYAGSHLLAVWLNDAKSSSLTSGLRALGFEVAKGFGFLAWIPALSGMWWFRDRLRFHPGSWVLVLIAGALWMLLWRLAAVVGYVSERHTILLILFGCYPAVAVLLKLGQRITVNLKTYGRRLEKPYFSSAINFGFGPGLLVIAFLVSFLPKSFEPLHANRSGFRDAGFWLVEHTHSCDRVLDPYCWTHYYAGRVFQEGNPQEPLPGYKPLCYVVLELSGNAHLRLNDIPAAKQLASEGRLVYEWEGARKKDLCIVQVYACPMKPLTPGPPPQQKTVAIAPAEAESKKRSEEPKR
ncbi:MAG: glycosyltransferase family 39 protein [Gemmataceae bacterium]